MSADPRLGDLLAEAISAADPGIENRIAGDSSAYVDLIALTARASAETDELLRSVISSARSAGHSWEAIGRLLGMTRQAAQQRFGGTTAAPATQGGTRRLAPLTAFDEMDVLNRVGVHGWHSVGFGPRFHIVEKSDEQWEHLRVLAMGQRRRTVEAQGWFRIGSMWFPWTYYKRPRGLPAEPEPRQPGT